MNLLLKLLWTYGPGSPGHTARAFCKLIKKITIHPYSGNWEYILYMAAKIRTEACLANPLGFDPQRIQLLAVSEERWKELIAETKGSLAVFVFIIMFFEGESFRNVVSNSNLFPSMQLKKNREEILRIIYKMIHKTPYNNGLTLEETLRTMDDIGGCYYFGIRTYSADYNTVDHA